MAISGVINIVDSASTDYTAGDLFVAIYKYLIGTQATAQGVSLIANQKGSGYSGTGFGYLGGTNAIGENTWAVFKFASATVPFFLLIQYASSSFGSSPGNPGVSAGPGLCIQVAMRGDGSSPWAGTTNKNGADTKGATVWSSNASGLAVFPRANSVGGSYNANREWCFNVFAYATGTVRAHFIIDPNNFVFAYSTAVDSNLWVITYFGKYVPMKLSYDATHSAVCAVPYVMFGTTISSTTCPIGYGTNFNNTPYCIYGLPAGGSIGDITYAGDGGVVHPVTPVSGSVSVSVDTLGMISNVPLSPNMGYTYVTYDVFPFAVFVNENNGPRSAPNTCGYLGETGSFISYACNVNSGDTSPDLKYVFLGPATQDTGKVMIPWSTAVTPDFTGTSGTNVGTVF